MCVELGSPRLLSPRLLSPRLHGGMHDVYLTVLMFLLTLHTLLCIPLQPAHVLHVHEAGWKVLLWPGWRIEAHGHPLRAGRGWGNVHQVLPG